MQAAKALNLGIAVEKLHKIKKTVRKQQRQRHNQWPFYQLRQFLKYKSQMAGLPYTEVNPAYTSQICSQCGHSSSKNRKTQSDFTCISCGLSINADLNAAINIAARASINEPIVASSVIAA